MLTRCGRASRGHATITLWVVMGVALSLLPATTPASGAYAQQSRTMNGIAVTGRFLEVWSRQGSDASSVYVNGLPITARRSEISLEDGRAYETQWFERARYELHPENPPPNDVLLGRLGAWDSEGRGKVDPATGKAANPDGAPFVPLPRPQDADGTRKLWFPETGHTLSGKLLEYWWRYGGLAQFGYPLSEPFEEISRADGKPYTVQLFERARMELHPEKPAPYEVELGLLGVEQVGMRAMRAEELPVAPPGGVQTSRESITIGQTQQPADLTVFNNSIAAFRIRSLIEDGLVGRDAIGNLFPLIAWYVPTIENGGAKFVGVGRDRQMQVKYKLRRGIKWSDGKDVTSKDVIFAYQLIMNPNSPTVSRDEYRKVQNVDNPDRYTVIFRYMSARQAQDFLNSQRNPKWFDFLEPFVKQDKPVISPRYSEVGFVLPAHVLSDIPPATIKESSPYARAPVGAGPWKVESWVTDVEMRLVSNEHYSLTPAPALKRITIKFSSDVKKLEDAALRGEVDLITSEAYLVPPARSDLQQAQLRMVSRPGYTEEYLFISFNYGPFKERAVREALMLAINRQQVVDTAFGGTGKVANSVIPSSSPFSLDQERLAEHSPEVAAKFRLPRYPYDPQKATRILEEAGWKLGTDGVRSKNGEKLKFVYGALVSSNPARQQAQILISTDLRATGMDVEVKHWHACFHCPQYHLVPFGPAAMLQSARINNGLSFEEWACREAYDPRSNSGLNEQHYCNPALDSVSDRLKTAIGLEARMASAEAQLILMQDIAVIPVVERPVIELVSSKLQNYTLATGVRSGFDGYMTVTSFWNARQWWFR
jgi:peptide/nickel transport system substrate-binding protein